MKPPDDSNPASPDKWLTRAESNFHRAKINREEILLEDLCFDAQQAAEKSIKAVYIYYNLDFPYTHNLNLLLNKLDSHGINIPDKIQDAVVLSDYAVTTRYPGPHESVTKTEYQQAVKHAKNVLDWATDIIQPQG